MGPAGLKLNLSVSKALLYIVSYCKVALSTRPQATSLLYSRLVAETGHVDGKRHVLTEVLSPL